MYTYSIICMTNRSVMTFFYVNKYLSICEAKTPKIISVAICSRSNDFLTGLYRSSRPIDRSNP